MILGSEEYWLAQIKSQPDSVNEAVQRMPTVDIWCRYVDSIGTTDLPSLSKIFQKGVQETQWDIGKSQVYWMKYKTFLEKYFPHELLEAFKQRLTVPHLQLEETYAAFSEYVRQNDLDYTETLAAANKLMSRSQKQIFEREKWEYQVKTLSQENARGVLVSYLEWELSRHNKNEFDFSRGLFERILAKAPDDDSLWRKYIRHCWVDRIPNARLSIPGDTRAASEIIDRAVFCLPKSPGLWVTKMRTQTSMESAIEIFNECTKAGVQSDELVFQFLYSAKELYKEHGILEDEVVAIFEQYTTSAITAVCASQMLKDLNQALAEGLLEKWAAQYPSSAQLWSQFLVVNEKKAISVYKKLRNNVAAVVIMEERLVLDSFTRTSQEIEKAYAMKREPLKESAKRSINSQEDEAPAKRLSHPSRDREHSSIVVTGEVSMEKLEDLLKNLTVVSLSHSKPYIIELGSKSEKMLALSQLNFCREHSITAHDATNTTLWINNYPPGWHDSEIKRVFSAYGDVQVRTMPPRGHSRRRFCYVQYGSAREAAAAVEALNGQHGMQVKFSDPSKKNDRSGPLEEGREVFVRGLPFNMPQDQVEQALSVAGKSLSIRVPPGRKGQANDGIAFLDFGSATEADSAAEKLNGLDITGRKITATIAQRQKPSEPKRNLDSTILIESCQTSNELFELLKPFEPFDLSEKGKDVVVTFTRIQDAGRALLALSGKEVNGSPLRVHNMAEKMLRPRNL